MPRIVSNRRQLTRLVELMRQNTDIAKANCTKRGAQMMWEAFAVDLNSLGPPTRDWQKWQRVWTDLKCKIKKKAIETGRSKLHHLEETVVQLLELKTYIRPCLPLCKPDSSRKPESCFPSRNLESFIPSRKPEPCIPDNKPESIMETDLIIKSELIDVADEVPIDINKTSDRTVTQAENLQLEHSCRSPAGHQDYETMTWIGDQLNDVVTNIKQEFEEVTDNTAEPKQRTTPQPEPQTSNSAKQQFYDTMTSLMSDIKKSVKHLELCAKKTLLLKKQHNKEILKLKRTKLLLYKHDLRLKIDILKHKRQLLNGSSQNRR